MQSHQQRVVNEQGELEDKIYKLTSFINSQSFSHVIDPPEQDRLKRQLKVMEEYSSILNARITAFK